MGLSIGDTRHVFVLYLSLYLPVWGQACYTVFSLFASESLTSWIADATSHMALIRSLYDGIRRLNKHPAQRLKDLKVECIGNSPFLSHSICHSLKPVLPPSPSQNLHCLTFAGEAPCFLSCWRCCCPLLVLSTETRCESAEKHDSFRSCADISACFGQSSWSA